MDCPKCGGGFRVVDSVPTPDKVYRLRRCLTCGHIVFTQESASEDFREPYYKETNRERRNREKVRKAREKGWVS